MLGPSRGGRWSPPPVWAAYPWDRGRVTSVFTEQDARCAFPVFQGFPLISARYLWLPGPPSFAFQKVGSMACCFWTNNRSVLRLRPSFKKKKKSLLPNFPYKVLPLKNNALNLALNRPEKTSKLTFVNGILHVQPGGPPRLGTRLVVCDLYPQSLGDWVPPPPPPRLSHLEIQSQRPKTC